jgi:rSAM/selenodomain-associated transferase 2
MSAGASVAVVVPVLGDRDSLGALLAQLEAQTPRPDEIIVVSGSPDAEVETLCRRHGGTYLEAAANRGAQLDRGAAHASAEILWFLHADATLPAQALREIGAAVARGADSGCFRFAFQGPPAWYKTLLERLVAIRVGCGGTPYGDQGLFACRDVYRACGGFTHQPLFEEVALVKGLRAGGRFRVLDSPLGVSTRRWERDGWWYRSMHNRWLATCYALGVPADRLARSYRGLVGSKTEADR